MVEISMIIATCDECGASIELDPKSFSNKRYGWYQGWYVSYDWTTCTCPKCNLEGGFDIDVD